MKEEWRPIRGYTGYYEVSNKGRIKSLKRTLVKSNGCKQTVKERILVTAVGSMGYPVVNLCKTKAPKKVSVHRLVAKAFLPKSKGKNEVNHINGIKTDNRLSNLEWVTRRGNVMHARELGISKCPPVKRGSESLMSKINEGDVKRIRRLAFSGRTVVSLAKEYELHPVTISNIKHRKTWKHVD